MTDSESIDVRRALGEIVELIQEDRLQQAETLCRQHIATSPREVNFVAILGATLLKRGDLDGAEQALEQAIALEPGFAKPHEDLGLLHLARDEPSKAAASFTTALKLDESLKAAADGLAICRQRQQAANTGISASGPGMPGDDTVAAAGRHWEAGDSRQAEMLCQQALLEHPDNTGALRLLAIIASEEERWLVAEGYLRRIWALGPDDIGAGLDLARFLGDRGRFPEAIAILEDVCGGDRAGFEPMLLLADMCAIVGDVRRALDAYERCLQTNQDDARAIVGRGHMLRIAGRLDEARASYRECLQKRPATGDAWWGLCSLQNHAVTDDEVATMRQQLEQEQLTDDAAIAIRFALARAGEQRKDYPGAWQDYCLGNRLKRESVRYDPVENEIEQRRIREVFQRELVADPGRSSTLDDAPIFIVGMPRSGSTLIEQVIASHKGVEGAGELPYVIMLAHALRATQDKQQIYPEAVRNLDRDAMDGLGRSYLHHAGSTLAGKLRFTDKMPANFAHVGLIRMMLPRAKIIDARRHPMATCVANFRQLFARGKNHSYDLTEMGEYYLQYVDMMRHWDEVLPGVVLRVDYEAVIADLETEIRRILAFCELPWDDACLRFFENERPVGTASADQVRMPIYSSAVDQWRNYEPWLGELKEILQPVLDTTTEANH